MNRKLLVGLLVLILAVGGVFVSKVFAGWTQPKGHAYTQLTYTHYDADQRYSTTVNDSNGALIGTGDSATHLTNVPKFESWTVMFYGEYGVIDNLTILTAIPHKWMRVQAVVDATGQRGPNGLSDIEIGFRYKLLKSLLGGPLSVQGKVKIPEAYKYTDPLTTLNLGDGQYDTDLGLFYGRGLGKGYASLLVSYLYRFPNTQFYSFKPSDQIKMMLGGGYSVTSKISIRGLLNYKRSVGNAKVSDGMILDAIIKGQILARTQDNMLVREVLGLEEQSISLSADLVYSIAPKMQTVFTYMRDGIKGIGDFNTKNANLGQSVSVALVYLY